ncbi:hypothetical protein FLJC2902T_12060 [Flavobacterium limnosediminis JC2902]|uniref:Uncharacterized protein n=1 Tax=Flavobacterium limnosediminis JC2902 TaxID=1341181 RepID=V6SRV4_9FLAO|nr:hypothetical protein [Flavobacterium limnosediminis]ESU29164.1 hypothetical protein FLJC2902T_12060 [Flavobacterium limnosediminis JC2902]
MKKNYLWATLLLPALSFAQTEAKELELDIRGRSCIGGLGICTALSSETNKTSMKNFNVSKQSYNTLLIQIEINKLSLDEQLLFFGKEYAKITPEEILEFIQDEDFIFDKDTLLYLGVDTKYDLLKKGNYPLKFSKDKVAVTLTLSEG